MVLSGNYITVFPVFPVQPSKGPNQPLHRIKKTETHVNCQLLTMSTTTCPPKIDQHTQHNGRAAAL